MRDDDFDGENTPNAFEQDPESDTFGEGYYTRPNGERVYGYDPTLARKLQGEGKATAEGRIGAGSKAPEKETADLRIGPGTADPELEQLQREGPKATSGAPPLAAPQPQVPSAISRMPLAGATVQRGASGTESSQSQTTRSALPEEEFQRQQQQTSELYEDAQSRGMRSRYDLAQGHQQRADTMRAEAQSREAAAAAAIAQQEQRKQEVARRITAVSQRPVDQGKIWKDKGVFGSIGALAGIYMNTYATTMLGTEPTIAKEFDRAKAQNIQDQLADKNSELRTLERELGSLDAAMPVFEARMNDAIAERTKALLVDEKHDEAIAAGQDLISKLEIEKQQKLQEAAKAYYGTVAQSQAQSATTSLETSEKRVPQGTGSGAASMEKALKLRKMMEENGYSREETDEAMRKMGFMAPGGESSIEFERRAKAQGDGKVTEVEAKAEAAIDTLKQYEDKLVNSGVLTRNKDGSYAASGSKLASLVAPPLRVEGVDETIGNATPLRDARDAAVEAFGRLQSGGVIGPEEAVQFRKMLGDNGMTASQLASKLNSIRAIIEAKRSARARENPKRTVAPASWQGQAEE